MSSSHRKRRALTMAVLHTNTKLNRSQRVKKYRDARSKETPTSSETELPYVARSRRTHAQNSTKPCASRTANTWACFPKRVSIVSIYILQRVLPGEADCGLLYYIYTIVERMAMMKKHEIKLKMISIERCVHVTF